MHRIEARQTYMTCRGGATSHYPETVVVQSYEAGARYDIPASYFHATATTKAGKRRITGYCLTGTLDD